MYVATPLITHCFQEEDQTYCSADFNNFDRIDTFDSDIWNNKECFTRDELATMTNDHVTNDNDNMNLYYVDEGKSDYELYERKWLETIFQRKIVCKPIPMNGDFPVANSWFLVQRPHLAAFNGYFTILDKKGIPFKVLHLSDEFEADDLAFYSFACCKAVIRNYLTPRISDVAHIRTIPLGYHYRSIKDFKNFTDRKFVWSFHGTGWFDRQNKLQALADFVPYSCHLTSSWNHSSMTKEEQYINILGDSKFCPILRGNNIETFRLYECLEAGTIPLYVRQEGDGAYWHWISSKLGDLKELNTWDEAKEFIDFLLKNPDKAENYRAKIYANWSMWKQIIQSDVAKFI